MEIIFAIAIATLVTSRSLRIAGTDLAFAVRGKQSPRQVAAAERTAARRNRTRGAFGSYLAELWRDAWTDVHTRHAHRRQRRAARTRPAGGGAFRSYARAVADDGWRYWDRAWHRAEENRRAKVRIPDYPPNVVVVPADRVGAVRDDPEPSADQHEPSEWTWPEWDTDDGQIGYRGRHRSDTADVPDDQQADPDEPTTERNPMSTATNTPPAEVTGLSSAITFCADVASETEQVVSAIEQTSASLQANGVGDPTTGHLASAQEHYAAAAAAMREAEARLTAHTTVSEAYNANPDAGTKEFVTAE